MSNLTFNPFEDRLSRDIRNAMSSALALAIETGDFSSLEKTIEEYRNQSLAPCYREYFEDRYHKFKEALKDIETKQSPIEQAVILWNQGLFFEVHEVLEHAWYSAKGTYKLTLQALIRAAGTYVKLECDYTEPAKKIANKAWPVLDANSEILEQFFNPVPLITALKNPRLPAPQLGALL